MSLVESLCERIALINHGRIVLYGALSDIKRQFSPNALEISPPLDLAGWPEVASATVHDGAGGEAAKQLIYLQPGVAHRDFLTTILERGLWVERFEMASMPLDQIFITVVTGKNHD
jgi:ABC-type uncharacterized transport system ATPase subunit